MTNGATNLYFNGKGFGFTEVSNEQLAYRDLVPPLSGFLLYITEIKFLSVGANNWQLDGNGGSSTQNSRVSGDTSRFRQTNCKESKYCCKNRNYCCRNSSDGGVISINKITNASESNSRHEELGRSSVFEPAANFLFGAAYALMIGRQLRYSKDTQCGAKQQSKRDCHYAKYVQHLLVAAPETPALTRLL